ncbi:family 16 glycosylhydrolase [Maribacter sp. 2210JD10-5]|uniref:family 16 glycosylhydrolase n=1 Tax=Maribacter sp. 2210JD10-5 TaxID=3386272 RepID=UPI0039BD111F
MSACTQHYMRSALEKQEFKMVRNIKIALLLIVCIAMGQLMAQDATKTAEYFTDSLNFANTPQRKTNELPLSHQDDTSWILRTAISDEFEEGTLNREKWYDTNPTWLGRKPSMLHKDNVALKNGELILSINNAESPNYPQGYTHNIGWVVSKESVTYGYFEMKAKLMDAPWVSCFWLYNWWYTDNWRTEIDICENNPGVVENRHTLTSNLHVFSAPPDKGDVTELKSFGQNYYIPFELQKEYHVWGLEWNKHVIRWYLDGILFRESENVYWHQNLHINLNSESNKWLYAFPDDERLDTTYNIDYIRVWKKDTD